MNYKSSICRKVFWDEVGQCYCWPFLEWQKSSNLEKADCIKGGENNYKDCF